MAKIRGKTLYVLGAGASVHTGAPLLRDFLPAAWSLLDHKGGLQHVDAFERVLKKVSELRSTGEYVNLDRDNLEHVFSMFELGAQIGISGAEDLANDLRTVVLETLDRLRLPWSGGQAVPDEPYSQFVRTLKALNHDRLSAADLVVAPDGYDTVVSFNYDVMLDYAMYFNNAAPKYYVNDDMGGLIPLLKLHGSINWVECSNQGCSSGLQIVRPTPFNPRQRQAPDDPSEKEVPFRMFLDVLPSLRCDGCGRVGSMRPVIIPPTWSKRVVGTPLARVWQRAVMAVGEAHQIVLIGYSLPASDTFFQYLLGLGLQGNARLGRVVIVNPDTHDSFKERVGQVFSGRLKERGRVIFQEQDFASYVGGMMGQYGAMM